VHAGAQDYLRPPGVFYGRLMTIDDSARAWRRVGMRECAHDWQWRNVPLPEAHLGVGAVALLLSIVRPQRLPWRCSGHAGWPLVIGGVTLAALATRAAGRTDLAAPDQIVTDGPYALSRHPMYVAWTAIYVGTALVGRAAWPLLLTPLLAWLTHRDVSREEQRLIDAFGPAYVAYQQRVRRYL
jgi:protein-S-isoprenylcysteine O-methyltransferase Ste14